MKKPGASRPETRLGLEVPTLAVNLPLLHGPWWTHGRAGCDLFVWLAGVDVSPVQKLFHNLLVPFHCSPQKRCPAPVVWLVGVDVLLV